MNQLSSEIASKIITNIEKFFQMVQRANTFEAVPFYVCTNKKNLKMDCKYIRIKNVESFDIYHCIQEDIVEYYIRTHNNLPNCVDCEFYETNK